MRAQVSREASAVHPKATIVPSVLLALTPLFDIVRVVTRDPAWSRAAFWLAFVGVVVATVAVIPDLLDWLATDRHTPARRAGLAPLTLHLAALAPLALGVFERLRLAALTRAAAGAAVPSLTRLDAWPMALAIAGALAWLVANWMREEPIDRSGRVRYQPTGLPSRA
jgi:uncharacterized membrane protein